MLTVNDAARHFGLKPDTLRRKIKAGELHAIRINRQYRLEWLDIWECEAGPMPKGKRQDQYKEPLISKKEMAAALRLSVRSIDRMFEDGLPTRSVFGATRCNPQDVTDWLCTRMGLKLPDNWWR